MRPDAYGSAYTDACRAEWIKARTLSSTGWLLAATIVLGVGLSAALCVIVHDQAGGDQDPAKLALSGVQLAQAPIAIWAVQAVTGEYRSGLIRTTLTATPRRAHVIAAKTTVIATLTLAASAITVASSILIARAESTAARLPLTASPTLRAGFGSILYLGLVSVLATGIALAARSAAAATGIALGLLYLFPLAALLAGSATWQRHLQQAGPTTAGLAIQATVNLRALPVGPWTGLAVLAAWSAASILAGGLALHLRDS